MKRSILLFMIGLLLISFSTAMASSLSDVQNSGVLNFGTSADYVPFVYYEDGSLKGLDIDLANEIGRRLGFTVKVYDLAFDGLIDAVKIGQVDLIGGALSVTDDRKALVDFSNVYYQSTAVLAAKSDAVLTDTFALSDFQNKLIGVQRGSSFDQWVRTNLVDTGIVPLRNVFEFPDESDLMKAVANSMIEVAILDKDLYEMKYAAGGDFKQIQSDLMNEEYAFAASLGSDLIPEVNKAFDEMKADGTLQKIIDLYLGMTFDTVGVISRPAQSVTTDEIAMINNQEKPQQIPVQTDCTNGMRFIRSITLVDDLESNYVSVNKQLRKIWEVQNTGTCTWDSRYTLQFLAADKMDGQNVTIDGTVAPGQITNLALDFVSPGYSDYFTGYWQFDDPTGKAFGSTLIVSVLTTTGNDALDWDQFLRANNLNW